MEKKTSVDRFNNAMILFVLFTIPFVFPIGLIVFGRGLDRLTRSSEKRAYPKCEKEAEPFVLFCKFCGAKLE